MKYPCLIPKQLCKIDIKVHLESEELNNFGEPKKVLDLELKCNYQDKAKTILTTEKKIVKIMGTALIPGDIATDMPSLSSGTVMIFGIERKIEQGSKNRNPDGTVNYSTLEVN